MSCFLSAFRVNYEALTQIPSMMIYAEGVAR